MHTTQALVPSILNHSQASGVQGRSKESTVSHGEAGEAELPTLVALVREGQWVWPPEGKLLVMGVCEGNYCF